MAPLLAFFFLVFFLPVAGAPMALGASEVFGEVTHLGKSLSISPLDDSVVVEACCDAPVLADRAEGAKGAEAILAATDILFRSSRSFVKRSFLQGVSSQERILPRLLQTTEVDEFVFFA